MKDKHIKACMKSAEAWASCSESLKLKVGAIAYKNGHIIAEGYNGLPSGMEGGMETREYLLDHAFESKTDKINLGEFLYKDDIGLYRPVSKPEIIHAEDNLLRKLTRSTESSVGASVFCTHSSCLSCAIKLVDAKISEFYFKHHYKTTDGLLYLKQNGVKVFETILNTDGFCVHEY